MLTSSRPGRYAAHVYDQWSDIFVPVWQGDHTLAQKYYFVSDLHMGGDGQLQHCDYATEFIEFLKELEKEAPTPSF
jgi:hypothetical protein